MTNPRKYASFAVIYVVEKTGANDNEWSAGKTKEQERRIF